MLWQQERLLGLSGYWGLDKELDTAADTKNTFFLSFIIYSNTFIFDIDITVPILNNFCFLSCECIITQLFILGVFGIKANQEIIGIL